MQATYDGSYFHLAQFLTWRVVIRRSGAIIVNAVASSFAPTSANNWQDSIESSILLSEQWLLRFNAYRKFTVSGISNDGLRMQFVIQDQTPITATQGRSQTYTCGDKTPESFAFPFQNGTYTINGTASGRTATPGNPSATLPITFSSVTTHTDFSSGLVYEFDIEIQIHDPRLVNWGGSCHVTTPENPERDGSESGWCNERIDRTGTVNNSQTARCRNTLECQCDVANDNDGHYISDRYFRRESEGGDICQCCYHPTAGRVTAASLVFSLDGVNGTYTSGPFVGEDAMTVPLNGVRLRTLYFPGTRLLAIPSWELVTPKVSSTGSVATEETTIWRSQSQCVEGWLPNGEITLTQCRSYYARRVDLDFNAPIWLSSVSYEDSPLFQSGDYAGWLAGELAAALAAECNDPGWTASWIDANGFDQFNSSSLTYDSYRYPDDDGLNPSDRFSWNLTTDSGVHTIRGSLQAMLVLDSNYCQPYPNPLP